MREDTHIDDSGRKFRVLLPDYEVDTSKGMIVGPPLLDELGLDEESMIVLHNELFRRNIFTFEDAKRMRMEIGYCLQIALRATAERIVEIYNG